jgi:hypothetical protein
VDRSVAHRYTTHVIRAVSAPVGPVYRITKLGVDPFEPAPWDHVGNNRFDDPRGDFRVVYCATERAAAFGETLARYRRSMSLLALMKNVVDDEESIEEALGGLVDPSDERRGVVPADWRFKRQMGSTVLDASLEFAAIAEPESVAHLRSALAPIATMVGLADFDLSAIFSSERNLTQHCARYIYDLHNGQGVPLFAGIRYPSRMNSHWTCWAIFEDRLIHTPRMLETTIDPQDPGFLEAARLLELSVETVRGHGTYITP